MDGDLNPLLPGEPGAADAVARTRTGAMKENPIPALKINGNLHFRKAAVEAWWMKQEEQKAA